MNQQPSDHRLRPGLVALMIGLLAAILVPLWMFKSKPQPAATVEPAAAASQPAATSETAAPAATVEPLPPTTQPVTVLSTALDEPWGMQISSVWLADDGAALGVSYKVLDPDKATLLSDDSIPVLLLDQASGARLSLRVQSPMGAVPKHSQARSKALAAQQPWSFPPPRNKLIAGREYSFVISNPQKTVKPGSLVVLVVGNFQTPEITVR